MFLFVVMLAASASVLLSDVPAKVHTAGWTARDDETAVAVIPQYLLAEMVFDDGYSLLMSSGFTINGATQICYPWRQGQFGWTSEIRVKEGQTWISIPTTTEWVPDEEGALMTCANAPAAGTYAVFGYWEKPTGWVLTFCVAPKGWWLMYDGGLLHPGDYCVSNHEVYSVGDGGIIVDLSPRLCCYNQVWAPPDYYKIVGPSFE